MKILLTGPTGFVGSTFIRLALKRNHQVAGLIIPTEPIPSTLPSTPALIWLRGTLETASWPEIASFKPDVCVHTAWITTPGIYLESPENEKFRDASFQFLSKVLDMGVRHVLALGTCIEYQIQDRPLAEDSTPIAPTSTYARCKDELRRALEAETKTRDFSFCWGRVFYPYGPGEHPSRLCSSIIQKLRQGEKIILKTPHSLKDYIYIEDLAEALLTVMEKGFRGNINLATGEGTTVIAIARALAELMGNPDLIEDAAKPERDPFPFVVADATRLKSLGWRPKVAIQEGLRRLVAAQVTKP
ncbi:MAG TPA: NAD(P)-dependent oxidoreductase [Candidatus Limnocylindrales bacterium]|nr:NAD(P)-dependent oxidoreductase [Candidatus Limnocylindrales bacterium]